MDEAIPIAFTTTSTEHTLESYRLSVLKYLEKPVKQKDLDDLLHLVKLQRDSAPRLAIRQNGAAQKLPLSELLSSGAEGASCDDFQERRQRSPALRQAVRPN